MRRLLLLAGLLLFVGADSAWAEASYLPFALPSSLQALPMFRSPHILSFARPKPTLSTTLKYFETKQRPVDYTAMTVPQIRVTYTPMKPLVSYAPMHHFPPSSPHMTKAKIPQQHVSASNHLFHRPQYSRYKEPSLIEGGFYYDVKNVGDHDTTTTTTQRPPPSTQSTPRFISSTPVPFTALKPPHHRNTKKILNYLTPPQLNLNSTYLKSPGLRPSHSDPSTKDSFKSGSNNNGLKVQAQNDNNGFQNQVQNGNNGFQVQTHNNNKKVKNHNDWSLRVNNNSTEKLAFYLLPPDLSAKDEYSNYNIVFSPVTTTHTPPFQHILKPQTVNNNLISQNIYDNTEKLQQQRNQENINKQLQEAAARRPQQNNPSAGLQIQDTGDIYQQSKNKLRNQEITNLKQNEHNNFDQQHDNSNPHPQEKDKNILGQQYQDSYLPQEQVKDQQGTQTKQTSETHAATSTRKPSDVTKSPIKTYQHVHQGHKQILNQIQKLSEFSQNSEAHHQQVNHVIQHPDKSSNTVNNQAENSEPRLEDIHKQLKEIHHSHDLSKINHAIKQKQLNDLQNELNKIQQSRKSSEDSLLNKNEQKEEEQNIQIQKSSELYHKSEIVQEMPDSLDLLKQKLMPHLNNMQYKANERQAIDATQENNSETKKQNYQESNQQINQLHSQVEKIKLEQNHNLTIDNLQENSYKTIDDANYSNEPFNLREHYHKNGHLFNHPHAHQKRQQNFPINKEIYQNQLNIDNIRLYDNKHQPYYRFHPANEGQRRHPVHQVSQEHNQRHNQYQSSTLIHKLGRLQQLHHNQEYAQLQNYENAHPNRHAVKKQLQQEDENLQPRMEERMFRPPPKTRLRAEASNNVFNYVIKRKPADSSIAIPVAFKQQHEQYNNNNEYKINLKVNNGRPRSSASQQHVTSSNNVYEYVSNHRPTLPPDSDFEIIPVTLQNNEASTTSTTRTKNSNNQPDSNNNPAESTFNLPTGNNGLKIKLSLNNDESQLMTTSNHGHPDTYQNSNGGPMGGNSDYEYIPVTVHKQESSSSNRYQETGNYQAAAPTLTLHNSPISSNGRYTLEASRRPPQSSIQIPISFNNRHNEQTSNNEYKIKLQLNTERPPYSQSYHNNNDHDSSNNIYKYANNMERPSPHDNSDYEIIPVTVRKQNNNVEQSSNTVEQSHNNIFQTSNNRPSQSAIEIPISIPKHEDHSNEYKIKLDLKGLRPQTSESMSDRPPATQINNNYNRSPNQVSNMGYEIVLKNAPSTIQPQHVINQLIKNNVIPLNPAQRHNNNNYHQHSNSAQYPNLPINNGYRTINYDNSDVNQQSNNAYITITNSDNAYGRPTPNPDYKNEYKSIINSNSIELLKLRPRGSNHDRFVNHNNMYTTEASHDQPYLSLKPPVQPYRTVEMPKITYSTLKNNGKLLSPPPARSRITHEDHLMESSSNTIHAFIPNSNDVEISTSPSPYVFTTYTPVVTDFANIHEISYKEQKHQNNQADPPANADNDDVRNQNNNINFENQNVYANNEYNYGQNNFVNDNNNNNNNNINNYHNNPVQNHGNDGQNNQMVNYSDAIYNNNNNNIPPFNNGITNNNNYAYNNNVNFNQHHPINNNFMNHAHGNINNSPPLGTNSHANNIRPTFNQVQNTGNNNYANNNINQYNNAPINYNNVPNNFNNNLNNKPFNNLSNLNNFRNNNNLNKHRDRPMHNHFNNNIPNNISIDPMTNLNTHSKHIGSSNNNGHVSNIVDSQTPQNIDSNINKINASHFIGTNNNNFNNIQNNANNNGLINNNVVPRVINHARIKNNVNSDENSKPFHNNYENILSNNRDHQNNFNSNVNNANNNNVPVVKTHGFDNSPAIVNNGGHVNNSYKSNLCGVKALNLNDVELEGASSNQVENTAKIDDEDKIARHDSEEKQNDDKNQMEIIPAVGQLTTHEIITYHAPVRKDALLI